MVNFHLKRNSTLNSRKQCRYKNNLLKLSGKETCKDTLKTKAKVLCYYRTTTYLFIIISKLKARAILGFYIGLIKKLLRN